MMRYKVSLVYPNPHLGEEVIARFALQEDAEAFVEAAQERMLFCLNGSSHVKIEGPGDYFRREEVTRG